MAHGDFGDGFKAQLLDMIRAGQHSLVSSEPMNLTADRLEAGRSGAVCLLLLFCACAVVVYVCLSYCCCCLCVFAVVLCGRCLCRVDYS